MILYTKGEDGGETWQHNVSQFERTPEGIVGFQVPYGTATLGKDVEYVVYSDDYAQVICEGRCLKNYVPPQDGGPDNDGGESMPKPAEAA